MSMRQRFHLSGRKGRQGPAAQPPEVPQGLPEVGASLHQVSLPERARSLASEDSVSTLSRPTSSAARGHAETSSSMTPTLDSSNVTPQSVQHSSPQGEGSSTVNAQKKSYWQLAVDELQDEDRSMRDQVAAVQQAAVAAGNADFAVQLLQTTQQGQKEIESKRWKISTGSREVILRDHFDRLVKAMTLYKDVGKAVGSIDPLHAGLPLAGFCVLMQIATNDLEQYAAMVAGVEEIVTIVARYSQIEALYQSRLNTVLKQEFERHLISLYKQIVRYQILATCYYRRNTMVRFIRALPKLDDISDVMTTIRRKDEACRNISQVFDSSDASERHQELLATLERFEKSLINQKDPWPPQQTGHKHWTVTRSINTLFTGRDDILSELETVARDAAKDPSRHDQCRMVITGMGGQGKSEICLQLAHRVRQAFWGVFWVDVSTATSAESAFLHIASRLQISAQTYEDALRGLANTQHTWLLILDNADDPRVDYQRYIPTGNLGVVVLTSRNQECDQYATKSITLDGLSDAEACELLFRAAKVPYDKNETAKDDTQTVVALLRSHPLALIQAGSYMSRGHCTMAEYPQVFAQRRQRLLKFHPTQARSRYGDVYATFEASAEILQSTGTESATDALHLLPILATFASSRLPLPLFEAGWKGAHARKAYSSGAGGDHGYLEMTKWHRSRLPVLMKAEADQWDPFRLVKAINLLEAFSLVSTDDHSGFRSVSMHPLIHAWARDRQDLTDQNMSWVTSGCIVAMSYREEECWMQHSRQLRPHLHALTAWNTSEIFVDCLPRRIACIIVKCGWLLFSMADYSKVDSLTHGLFGDLVLDGHTVEEEWLELYDLKARNLREIGNSEEAVLLSAQIVKSQEQTLPEDDRNRLTSQEELARGYETNGQIQKAIPLLEHVVQIQEQTLREDHLGRLISQNQLASAYRSNGQTEEAHSLLEHVVNIQEQTLREDHPSRLTSQHNLAICYWELDRRNAAHEMMTHVVKIRRQVLDEHHPVRMASEGWLEGWQIELARECKANGHIEEAIALLEPVVKIQEQTLREDHPSRLNSQHNLATYYWDTDHRDAAIEMMAYVVKMRRQVLDELHPDRIDSEAWLENWQTEEAILLLEPVFKAQEQTLEEDNPERLDLQCNLAIYYWDFGRRNAAIEMMAHVVKIERQVLDEHHPDRVKSERQLKRWRRRLGSTQAG